MTLFRNGASFATIGGLLILACSAPKKQDEPLSPAMKEALHALGDLPISVRADPPTVGTFDAGTGFPAGDDDDDNQGSSGGFASFGESGAGKSITEGIGSRGPTGNGAGNGGVGTGTGPGSGGIGSGTGPGNGGVGDTTVGAGGVGTGSSAGGDLGAVICEFLSAFCSALSKCSRERSVDESCNFSQQKCSEYVDEIVSSVDAASIPPTALVGIRCVSKALRSSECLLSENNASELSSKIRACGLPVSDGASSNAGDDDDDDIPPAPPPPGTGTTIPPGTP